MIVSNTVASAVIKRERVRGILIARVFLQASNEQSAAKDAPAPNSADPVSSAPDDEAVYKSGKRAAS